MNEVAVIPDGMIEVTRDQFFLALYRDPRDIMPKLTHPTYSNWETRERKIWGWSFPGWKNVGETSRYAINAESYKQLASLPPSSPEELGRLGGLSTSQAKVSASRSNGKLGGRPKKQIVILD